MKKTIIIAGATGNLGNRICKELISRNALVIALVRTSTDPDKIDILLKMGVQVRTVDFHNVDEIAKVCLGADCVVSALAGLADVIVDLQKNLLDGAIKSGIPRFIPSDFCTNYNDLIPGENRNFDLRRTFKSYLDNTSISASSIYNGAFADILKYNTPVLNLKDSSVSYWGDKSDWKLDFTTMDDTAAFTAEVALDKDTPRDLEIASFQISPNMIWKEVKEATGKEFIFGQMSSIEDFAEYIKWQRAENPNGEHELYAKWQQSQYMYSMFTAQHHQLSNERYKNLNWTDGTTFIRSFVNR